MAETVDLDVPSLVEAILYPDRRGDRQTFNALIECACQRLRRLTHWMLHRQFPDLCRWVDTDDVLQGSLLRLHRSLRKIQPRSAREFYGLAAKQIRWELLDLCRRYYGPHGIGANCKPGNHERSAAVSISREHEPADDAVGPADLLDWAEFHKLAGTLPDKEREIFELLWYRQLSQQGAAVSLGVSSRTVKRRWRRARRRLHAACRGLALD